MRSNVSSWKYQHARRKLDASLNHWVKKQRVARGLSTAEDEGIADMNLLDVRDLSLSGLSGFQKEMFLELPQQHRTTLEDAEVSDAELQSPDVLDMIMEKLLNNAIEHFGYAARDIYTYLRNPAAVLSVHDDTYLPWKHAVTFLNTYLATGRAFMMEGETTQGSGRLSHRICALKLNELVNKANFWVSDSFTVVWKSPYIHSEMERKQQELTDEDRGKLFALLSVHPKATTFAGNIYEPYVHKVLRTPGSISSSPLDLPPMQPMTYRPRTCVECGSKSSACPHTTDCVYETTTEQCMTTFLRDRGTTNMRSSLIGHNLIWTVTIAPFSQTTHSLTLSSFGTAAVILSQPLSRFLSPEVVVIRIPRQVLSLSLRKYERMPVAGFTNLLRLYTSMLHQMFFLLLSIL